MRFKTLFLAIALLFVAGTTFAQMNNPFAAFLGNFEMKLTKAEPALPAEAMNGIQKGVMKATPDNTGMIITWNGMGPDGKPYENYELWYADKDSKKIYGINTEGGRVVRMEGDISADGKTLTFTGSYPSSPKETYKMEVKMMGNMVSFKNTIMMDGKQVQYMEGKSVNK
ncbi:MAG: hypothetical protein SFU99_13715 [Saprospiraceae bacterium]|nr:hypothetical protein [Saprospiraceae bacterium]